MVGKLLNILEADKRIGMLPDHRETRGCLMLGEAANGLEGSAGPPCLKSPPAHVIRACDNGRGKQERVFQPDSSDVCRQIYLFNPVSGKVFRLLFNS